MLAAWTGIAALPDADLDPGGVTFDFARLSDERFPLVVPNVGSNLLTRAWAGTVVRPDEQIVALPHARGGKFRISAWTKVHLQEVEKPVGSTAIMIRFGSGAKPFVENSEHSFVWCGFRKRGDRWWLATKTFDVRPGETHLRVLLHCDNARIELRDVVLCEEVPQPQPVKAAVRAPVTVDIGFCDYIGGTFQVSEGQVGELAVTFSCPGRTRRDLGAGIFRLELPSGLVFVDASFGRKNTAKTTVNADGSSVTEFRPAPGLEAVEHQAWWESRFLLVAATGAQGPCGTGRLTYVSREEGCAFEAKSADIAFSIVPRIEGEQPSTFRMASWLYRAYEFDDLASVERIAAFHATCGQNMIIPNAARNYPALGIWRKLGFTVLPETSAIRNGYQVSGREEIPETDRFIPVSEPEPRFAKAYRRAVCPLAVVERTPFVRDVVLPRLAADARGVDGLASNWEPFGFRGNGCACSRCGRAFAEFVGKDWSSLSNEWPACAFEGGADATKGEEFRSRCHGRLVKVLERAVRDVTGVGSIGFVPEIHFGQMTSSWRTSHPMPEASPEHYAAGLPWINLWGPYVPWSCSRPYMRERGRHVIHFACARDLRDQLAADYPAGERPHVLMSPQGTSGDYFSQPEVFEMNFDAYFFNGFAACCPWAFPMGADARYWRAFANASRRAARYGDVVAKGVPADAQVTLEAVPEYAAPVERLVPYLSKWRKVPQLFSSAYDRGGRRVVAVFNCWQLGEAFVTLKARGLPPGDYRIVSHDGILWTKDRDRASWSAEELARGVFLTVGSVRTRVFEIVSAEADALVRPTAVMTSGRLQSLYAARRAALARASACDAAEAKEDLFGISRCD